MNKRAQQNVVIKGTKEGFMLHLDDACSFAELLKELKAKLAANYQFQENDPVLSVKLHTGNRILNEEQENQVKEIIESKKKLVVEQILSNVIKRDEALKWKEENQISTINKVVRSGQILEVPGDLLLIGDVNPDATVRAGGSIYIMGQLRGIAHAGFSGNDQAVIAASVMAPAQLRIADEWVVAPHDDDSIHEHKLECAYMNDEAKIIIDKLHVLKKYRPNFNRLEGGL